MDAVVVRIGFQTHPHPADDVIQGAPAYERVDEAAAAAIAKILVAMTEAQQIVGVVLPRHSRSFSPSAASTRGSAPVLGESARPSLPCRSAVTGCG